MGTNQRVEGTCQVCRRKGVAISSNHGRKMCGSCTMAYTAVNQRPEVVAQAIRELGKTDDIARMLEIASAGDDHPAPPAQMELAEALAELASIRALLGIAPNNSIRDAIDALKESNRAVRGMLSLSGDEPNPNVGSVAAYIDSIRGVLGIDPGHDILSEVRAVVNERDQVNNTIAHISRVLPGYPESMGTVTRIETLKDNLESRKRLQEEIGAILDIEGTDLLALADMVSEVELLKDLSDRRRELIAAIQTQLGVDEDGIVPAIEELLNYVNDDSAGRDMPPAGLCPEDAIVLPEQHPGRIGAIDTWLLALLCDFPAIGVSRIAAIRSVLTGA